MKLKTIKRCELRIAFLKHLAAEQIDYSPYENIFIDE